MYSSSDERERMAWAVNNSMMLAHEARRTTMPRSGDGGLISVAALVSAAPPAWTIPFTTSSSWTAVGAATSASTRSTVVMQVDDDDGYDEPLSECSDDEEMVSDFDARRPGDGVDALISAVLAEPPETVFRRFAQEPVAARTLLCAPMLTRARRRATAEALLKLFPFCIPAELFVLLSGFIQDNGVASLFARKLQAMIDAADRREEDTVRVYAAAAAAIGAGWTTNDVAPNLCVNPDFIWRHYACSRGECAETIDYRARTMQWFTKQPPPTVSFDLQRRHVRGAARRGRTAVLLSSDSDSEDVYDETTSATGAGGAGSAGGARGAGGNAAPLPRRTPGQIAMEAGLHTMRCRGMTGMLHAAVHATARVTDTSSMAHAWTVVHAALMRFPNFMNLSNGCATSCPCTLQCAWRVAHIVAAHAWPTTELWDTLLEAYRVAPVHMTDVIRNAFHKHPAVLEEPMLAAFPKLCCMAAADGSPFVHPDASLIPDVVSYISERAPVFVDIAARVLPGSAGNADLMAAFAVVAADAASVSSLLGALAQLPFLFDTIALRLLANCLADWTPAQLVTACADGTAAALAASARVRALVGTQLSASRWRGSAGVVPALEAGWGAAFFFKAGMCTPVLLIQLSNGLINSPLRAPVAVTFELLLQVCEHMHAELVENALVSWYERHGAFACHVATPQGATAWFACMRELAHTPDMLTARLLLELMPLNGTAAFHGGCCCGTVHCNAFVAQVRALQDDDHAMMLRLLCEYSTCWDAPAWAGVRAWALGSQSHCAAEDWQWAAARLSAGALAGHFVAPGTAMSAAAGTGAADGAAVPLTEPRAPTNPTPYPNLLDVLSCAARALPTKTVRCIPQAAVSIAARTLVRARELAGASPADIADDLRTFIRNLLNVRALTGSGRAFFSVNSSSAAMHTLTLLELAHAAGIQPQHPDSIELLRPLFAHAWALRPSQTTAAGYISHTERLAALNSIELVECWVAWAAAPVTASRTTHAETHLLRSCFKILLDTPDSQLLLHAAHLAEWAAMLVTPDRVSKLHSTFPLCVHVLCALASITPARTARDIVDVCATLVHHAGAHGAPAQSVLDCILTGAVDGTPVPAPQHLVDVLFAPLREPGVQQADVIAAVHALACHRHEPSTGIGDTWVTLFNAIVRTNMQCVDTLALAHAATGGVLGDLETIKCTFGADWALDTPTVAIQKTMQLLQDGASSTRISAAFAIASALTPAGAAVFSAATAAGGQYANTADDCPAADATPAILTPLQQCAHALIQAGIQCPQAAALVMHAHPRAPAILLECVNTHSGPAALFACFQAAAFLTTPAFVAHVHGLHADERAQFYARMLASDVREILMFICLHTSERVHTLDALKLRIALLTCTDLVTVGKQVCAQTPDVFARAIAMGMGDALHWLGHEIKQRAPEVSSALLAQCATNNVTAPATPAVECTVCFEPVTPLTLACNMPCPHIFHVKCLTQWFDSSHARTCPMCRTHCAIRLKTHYEDAAQKWIHAPLHALRQLQDLQTDADDETAAASTAAFDATTASAIPTFLPQTLPTHTVFADTDTNDTNDSDAQEVVAMTHHDIDMHAVGTLAAAVAQGSPPIAGTLSWLVSWAQLEAAEHLYSLPSPSPFGDDDW